jgi:hypothetical protein
MSNPFSATFSARFCPITASPHSPIRDFSPAPFAAVARVVAVIPRRRPARVVASRLRAAVVAFVVADLAAHAMVASRNRNRAQSINQSINRAARPLGPLVTRQPVASRARRAGSFSSHDRSNGRSNAHLVACAHIKHPSAPSAPRGRR